jgi:ligand-binding SRPBCC domain-containing protein
VFAFFSDAYNLEKITPPFLQFRVLGMNTDEIKEGTLIDYKLKVRGLPIAWQSRIEEWKPPYQFVDTQVKGPYALWHHTHLFTAHQGGTLITDQVKFRVPLGFLGEFFAGWFVRRDVNQIFEYRKKVISDIFANHKISGE